MKTISWTPFEKLPLDFIFEIHRGEVRVITITNSINGNCWTLFPSGVISFEGLDICFQIVSLHMEGLVLINSDNSVPRPWRWGKLFSDSSIFTDAMCKTGWITIS